MRRLTVLLAALLGFAALRAATPEEVNRLAGIDLFGGTELWKESPQAVVKRLGIKCRAEKSGSEEMFSARVNREIFECPASEIRLAAADGKVTKLDIILFNKGDNAGKGSKRNAVKKELRRYQIKLEKLLRTKIGRPRRAFFGAGTLSKQLPAWDCGPHVLMVDYSESEYLQIHIVPEKAAGEHRARVSSEARAESADFYSGNVRRKDNGDVFIEGVPMVDQGSKGYCVPATVERVLRYFGVADADMHKLAEKSHTGLGGGTTLEGVVRGTRKLLADYGLRMRDAGKFRRPSICRYIDHGLPVLWFHYSTPAFKERLDESLAERSKSAPGEWKKHLEGERKIRRAAEGAHIALLIGYNKETDEFAVSNSWGERYRIAWVRFADMEQADAKLNIFVVVPRK